MSGKVRKIRKAKKSRDGRCIRCGKVPGHRRRCWGCLCDKCKSVLEQDGTCAKCIAIEEQKSPEQKALEAKMEEIKREQREHIGRINARYVLLRGLNKTDDDAKSFYADAKMPVSIPTDSKIETLHILCDIICERDSNKQLLRLAHRAWDGMDREDALIACAAVKQAGDMKVVDPFAPLPLPPADTPKPSYLEFRKLFDLFEFESYTYTQAIIRAIASSRRRRGETIIQ